MPDSDEVGAGLPFQVITKSAFFDGAIATEREGPEYTDVACMIYTSGTTGPSKGVLVPWPELYWFDVGVGEHMRMFTDARIAYYSFLPVYHISGKLNVYLPAKSGGRLAIRDGFSLQEFWNDVREFDCNAIGLVGPIARLLLLNPEQPNDADNPVVLASCGPLFPEIDVFKKRFGVEMLTGYGMTEIGVPRRTGPRSRTGKAAARRETAVPVTRSASSTTNDEDVGPGNVGELIVRADEPWAMNAGYYGMPEQDGRGLAQRLVPHRRRLHVRRGRQLLLRRSDQGRDPPPRREHLVVRGRGATCNEHPDVAESAAVGVPSELAEDEVKVFVVRRPEVRSTAQELIEFLIPHDAAVHGAAIRRVRRRSSRRPKRRNGRRRSSSVSAA